MVDRPRNRDSTEDLIEASTAPAPVLKYFDPELPATADRFRRWRRYVEGTNHQVQAITDHSRGLFMTRMALNRRQARLLVMTLRYSFGPGSGTPGPATYQGARSTS